MECSASHDVMLVIATVIVVVSLAMSGFLIWGFREGERQKMRRDAESQANYDAP